MWRRSATTSSSNPDERARSDAICGSGRREQARLQATARASAVTRTRSCWHLVARQAKVSRLLDQLSLLLLNIQLQPVLLHQLLTSIRGSRFSSAQPLLQIMNPQLQLASRRLLLARARLLLLQLRSPRFNSSVKVSRGRGQLRLRSFSASVGVALHLREVAALLHEFKAALVDCRQHALRALPRLYSLR